MKKSSNLQKYTPVGLGSPSGFKAYGQSTPKDTLDQSSLRTDFQTLVAELVKDKIDIIKEFEDVTKESVRRKTDALAWHGRVMNIISPQAAQESVVQFKKAFIPTDNQAVKSAYIRLQDHNSQAIQYLSQALRTEALHEKMILSQGSRGGGNFSPRGQTLEQNS